MVFMKKVPLSESSMETAEKMPPPVSPKGIAEAIDLPDDPCYIKASTNLLTNRIVESDVTPHAGDQGKANIPRFSNKVEAKKAAIDTAVPFESVKEAVSRLGGIIDWNARRAQRFQRRKSTGQELDKSEAIAELRREAEVTGDKFRLPEDLFSTNKLTEELKLNLERVQREEQEATQESERARLRVEELEQEIASEAAKAQLEVDQARHTAAVSDLKSTKEELESLRKEYASMMVQRNIAVKMAEEAIAACRKIEKTVKCLTIELESLEIVRAVQSGPVDKVCYNMNPELQNAEEKLQRLNQQVLAVKDLKSKLDATSSLLLDLKAELAAYMESKLNQEGDEERKKKLEEVKLNIEKATSELNSVLTTIGQTEEMTSVSLSSLKAKLDKTRSEVAWLKIKKGDTEKMIELPRKLEEAEQEADRAKSVAQAAQIELREAKEEAEQAKARASTMESRLLAAQTEVEDAKYSEKLAIEAIKALQESESAGKNNDMGSPSGITLGLVKYYELSKQAHEAEKQANLRVAAANSQVDLANESELRSLNKLEEVNQELAARRESLKMATEKAEKAVEGKLSVEQELRKWRAEQERQKKASFEGKKESNISDLTNVPSNNTLTESAPETESKKKKKQLFPRVIMFFAKRKSRRNKKM